MSTVTFSKDKQLTKPSLHLWVLWNYMLWGWGPGSPSIFGCFVVHSLPICIYRAELCFIVNLLVLSRRPKLFMCSFSIEESEVKVLECCPPFHCRLVGSKSPYLCVECQLVQNRNCQLSPSLILFDSSSINREERQMTGESVTSLTLALTRQKQAENTLADQSV